jgi:hypothetical protein
LAQTETDGYRGARHGLAIVGIAHGAAKGLREKGGESEKGEREKKGNGQERLYGKFHGQKFLFKERSNVAEAFGQIAYL